MSKHKLNGLSVLDCLNRYIMVHGLLSIQQIMLYHIHMCIMRKRVVISVAMQSPSTNQTITEKVGSLHKYYSNMQDRIARDNLVATTTETHVH